MLKIDKDCHVESQLELEYVRNAVLLLTKYCVRVKAVKATRTLHGSHYYIEIAPPVSADASNRLQYLLGDDTKRVAYNKARIESGLQEWNKLFEKPGAKLRTIYPTNQIDKHENVE